VHIRRSRPQRHVRSSGRTLFLLLGIILATDLVATTLSFVIHRGDVAPLPPFKVGARPSSEGPQLTLTPGTPSASYVLGLQSGTTGVAQRPATAPDELAADALGLLSSSDRGPEEIARAKAQLRRATAGLVDGVIPHSYRASNSNGLPIATPWYSANSQGAALSAAVTLARVTGEGEWRQLANRLYNGVTQFRDFSRFGRPDPGDPWISMVDDSGYLWFEQAAGTTTPSLSMTGHITTLLAVYDYWRLTNSASARTMFRGGEATVARYINEFRVRGGLSRDGLPSGIQDPQRQARLVQQLRMLAKAAPGASFDIWANNFAADLSRPRLPGIKRLPVTFNADVDPYSPLPSAYGFDETPAVRPPGQSANDAASDPDEAAKYALVALDRYRQTRDRAWLVRAERAVNPALRTTSAGLFPHLVKGRSLDGPMDAPWFSATTQGLMLSVMSRLATETRDPVWRQAADSTFRTLFMLRASQNKTEGAVAWWVSVADDLGYVWFEQYPQGKFPALSLNAHLFASLGVYDYWLLTRSPAAQDLFRAAMATTDHYLSRFLEPGGVALVGLGSGRREVDQQRIVAAQLDTLGRITGRGDLARAAAEWRKS
jgi:hypothetical protein